MDKDTLNIALVISSLFLLTLGGHMLIKGDHGKAKAENSIKHNMITVYASEQECRAAGHSGCQLQLCETIPGNDHDNDICGEGYKAGWKPKKSSATQH